MALGTGDFLVLCPADPELWAGVNDTRVPWLLDPYSELNV